MFVSCCYKTRRYLDVPADSNAWQSEPGFVQGMLTASPTLLTCREKAMKGPLLLRLCLFVLTALLQMRESSIVIILRPSQKYNKRTRYGEVTSACPSPCLTLQFVRRLYFICASPPLQVLSTENRIYDGVLISH